MENNNIRKRKGLLLLPILIIPFLTLAFWAGGGGRNSTEKQDVSSGLNMQLPDAHLKNDKDEDKLSFYEKAERDSAKFRQEIKNDPFFQMDIPGDTGLFKPGNITLDAATKQSTYKDTNEQKVYQKLDELNRQLNSNPTVPQHAKPVQPETGSGNKEDVDRLEGLLKQTGKDSEGDPEMEQLNTMMEKILDIQHPDRVKERFNDNGKNNNDEFFKVIRVSKNPSVSLLDTSLDGANEPGSFYSIEKNIVKDQNAIEAEVQKDESLTTGAVIRLRLLNDISVGNKIIPKGNFVNGTVSIANERMLVEINSIRVGESIFPIKLKVYDLDGLEGIYIPGAISRDAAKESLGNATQLMQISSLDPSMAAQAAGAGLDAAKTLLSKKTRLVKATVKAGYKVLLK